MIANVGDEKFSGGDETAQALENLLVVDRVQFQKQVLADVINPAEGDQLALKRRESRKHSLARLERFDIVADQTVEKLNRVFAAQLQFSGVGEINQGDAAANRVVLAAKIAIIFRQNFAHFFHLLAAGPIGPIDLW